MIDNIFWKEYRLRVPQGTDPDPTDAEALRMREKIIVENIGLAAKVVGKMKRAMPTHVERDDLESWAKIGLMQAVKRYNNELPVPFEAFAALRMRSVIMDGIRDADWAPRSLRKKQRAISSAAETFKLEEHREPTDKELAEILNVSLEEISATKHSSEIAAHTYIEGNIEANNKFIETNTEESSIVRLMMSTLSDELKNLPLQQAAVIALHYYEEKKLFEIAQLLKINEVKIGKLHSEAVLSLWEKLEVALNSE